MEAGAQALYVLSCLNFCLLRAGAHGSTRAQGGQDAIYAMFEIDPGLNGGIDFQFGDVRYREKGRGCMAVSASAVAMYVYPSDPPPPPS